MHVRSWVATSWFGVEETNELQRATPTEFVKCVGGFKKASIRCPDGKRDVAPELISILH